MKLSKSIGIIVFATIHICSGSILWAQSRTLTKNRAPITYVEYYSFGLGANLFKLQPNLVMKGTSFKYTYESNVVSRKQDIQIQRVSSGRFRQSSIDSILSIIKQFGDTVIYKSNPCVMSGGVEYLIVSNGIDTTKFTLDNTTDRNALKIIDIINDYLPVGKTLPRNENKIKKEEDCRQWMKELDRKLIDSLRAASKS